MGLASVCSLVRAVDGVVRRAGTVPGCVRAGMNLVKKIYVGNLPWSSTEADLRDLFATYGEVASAAVITDRETGRSRGFGFVELEDAGAADKAIAELDGRDFGGRSLRVNEAQEKRRGGGGGGGGGGRW